MASKGIKISIATALNNAGINATRSQINSLAKSLKGSMGEASQGVRRHMADIKAGFDLTVGAIKTAWKGLTASLKSAFKFETQTTHFKTLIGDIDAAKRHMADLKALGDMPPFGLDEFAAASRSMLVMTDGVLGYKKSLELVGDAAAATGIPITQMGHAVGRLYAFIRDGQPLSRAVMELRNMGVITPEVAQKLQDLQAAGASNVEIWQEVEKQLSRYNGAMAETEKTGTGLIGAIETRWDNSVRAFGQAFQESAKGGITQVLEKLKELEESGSIDVWADRAARAAVKVAEAFKTVGGWIDKASSAYGWAKDRLEVGAAYIGGTVGALWEGASLKDAKKIGIAHGRQVVYEQDERDADNWKREEEIKIAAHEKSAKAKVDADKRAAEESKRIADNLAAAQAKIAEKAAKKAADESLKEKRKEIEEERKMREKALLEEIATARQKRRDELNAYAAELRRLHDERLAQLDAEAKKLDDQIRALEAVGADNVMARAGGGVHGRGTMDQAETERARRQRIKDNIRAIDAEQKLREKMEKSGATLDNAEEKMGRLSNLEQAALEKMRLDKARQEAQAIQQERNDRIKQISDNLADINDRLKEVGL